MFVFTFIGEERITTYVYTGSPQFTTTFEPKVSVAKTVEFCLILQLFLTS